MYKDIVDNGFYYTKKFYEFKKPVFSKYATECVEINLRPDELTSRSNKIMEDRSQLTQPLTFIDDRDKT